MRTAGLTVRLRQWLSRPASESSKSRPVYILFLRTIDSQCAAGELKRMGTGTHLECRAEAHTSLGKAVPPGSLGRQRSA